MPGDSLARPGNPGSIGSGELQADALRRLVAIQQLWLSAFGSESGYGLAMDPTGSDRTNGTSHAL